MEEVNINEILNYFKTKLGIIIIITLFITLLGLMYTIFLKTPQYTSTSTIVLAASEGVSTDLQTNISLNQKLVDTYKVIVKSRNVLEKTIEELDLNLTYEELEEKVSVASVTNTEVIKISVEDESANEAQEIVTNITSIFTEEVSDLYDIKNIKILDKASTPLEPSNINLIQEIIIYFLVGSFISFVLYFIKFYFDTTIKTIEQVESITNLPIIGAIPVIEERKGQYE